MSFRRKIRTLSGNVQLVARFPQSLLPWRNPVCSSWSRTNYCGWSGPGRYWACWRPAPRRHSDLRGNVPAQVISYLFAVLGFLRMPGHRRSIVSAGASFLVLNAAAWLAFWVWISGRSGRSWNKVAYEDVPLHDPASAPTAAKMPAETGNLV